MSRRKKLPAIVTPDGLTASGYEEVLIGIVDLLEASRRRSARAVNSIITSTYWDIGRRIVEFEQGGKDRSAYGEGLIRRVAADLTLRFGRGFSLSNVKQFRKFYLLFQVAEKGQTAPGFLEGEGSSQKSQTTSGLFTDKARHPDSGPNFPLPWSHYVLLLKIDNAATRRFYESEVLRGGWTVRQLDRQISTLFYERTLASRKKTAMLTKGAVPKPGEEVTAEEEIKDPFVLEFLGLKDEYSENELEDALIQQLESFLLELGSDFAFVGRQRRLRIGDEWYRVDLLFFHRKLRSLIVIDLKLGKFTHADAGQMHLYLNYAAHHWMNEGENPPVGIILCAQKDHALARYALEQLPNKVIAAQYRTSLPDEETLAAELERTRKRLESRTLPTPKRKKTET